MTAPTNPSFDIAHLGHVEMFTDRYDESLDFFTRIYGLKLSGEDARSASGFGMHLAGGKLPGRPPLAVAVFALLAPHVPPHRLIGLRIE